MGASEPLAQSIFINSIKIKNRLAKTATQENMADNEGIVNQDYCNHYDKLSSGEIGLIITGNMHITSNGRNKFGIPAGANSDEQIPPLRKVTNIVHNNRAIIFAQLNHAGFLAYGDKKTKKKQAPSNNRWGYAMNLEEIKETVEAFAQSAGRMKKAEFDGVQIHGAHSYLVAQFLSKRSNRRKDQYGGSLKNRQRFCLEVYQAIRSEVGEDFPITIKLDSYSNIPFISNIELEESLDTAKRLEKEGIDAVEVSCGLNIVKGSSPYKEAFKEKLKTEGKLRKAAIVEALLTPSNILFNRRSRFKPHHNIEHIKSFKQKLKIPILGVSCFRDPIYMRHVINNHEADIIGLARPLIHNPNYPNEILKGSNKKSTCLNCNLCLFLLPSSQPLQCYYGKTPSP